MSHVGSFPRRNAFNRDRSFDYSPHREELTVEFVTGRRYVYSAVPQDAADSLRSAFSKGVHFNRHIRGRFPWREIGGAEEE